MLQCVFLFGACSLHRVATLCSSAWGGQPAGVHCTCTASHFPSLQSAQAIRSHHLTCALRAWHSSFHLSHPPPPCIMSMLPAFRPLLVPHGSPLPHYACATLAPLNPTQHGSSMLWHLYCHHVTKCPLRASLPAASRCPCAWRHPAQPACRRQVCVAEAGWQGWRASYEPATHGCSIAAAAAAQVH